MSKLYVKVSTKRSPLTSDRLLILHVRPTGVALQNILTTFADGFVEYVNAQQAQQLGLLRTQGSQVYMGVDTTSVLNPNGPGRKSVRIQSKRAYNRALVIADFAHVPGSNCGSWPALYVT